MISSCVFTASGKNTSWHRIWKNISLEFGKKSLKFIWGKKVKALKKIVALNLGIWKKNSLN